MSDPLQLELQVAVSHLKWGWGPNSVLDKEGKSSMAEPPLQVSKTRKRLLPHFHFLLLLCLTFPVTTLLGIFSFFTILQIISKWIYFMFLFISFYS